MADLKTELIEAGVDYEGALERFIGRDGPIGYFRVLL